MDDRRGVVVLKVGKYHSIFLSLREVFFGSISIIAHTQLDVGYFEAEACFFSSVIIRWCS